MKTIGFRGWLVVQGILLAALAGFGCSGQTKDDLKPVQITIPIKYLAVVPMPAPDVPPSTQDDVLRSLGAKLAKRYNLQVLAGRIVGRAIWGELDTSGDIACKAFSDKVAEASKAYRELRIGKSIELSREAQGLLPKCGAEFDDSQPLYDLYLNAGLALLSRDKKKEALDVFRQLVSFDPERPLPETLRPNQLEAVSLAQRQLLSGKPTLVKIDSLPPGASVTIDGRSIGPTPLAGTPLYPGLHFVRIEMKGHSTWTANLPNGVPPKTLQALILPLWKGEKPTDLQGDAFDAELSEAAAKQAIQAAELFEVDALLLVRMFWEENKSLALDTRLFVTEGAGLTEALQFDLGSKPKGFGKRLDRVAKAYPELKMQPRKVAPKKPPKKPVKKPIKKKKKKKRKKKKKKR